MNSGIYKWSNKKTGSTYIGQAKDLNKRCREFLNFKNKYAGSLINEERQIYNSLIYWNYEILEKCEEKILNEREKYWIHFYQDKNENVLNIRLIKNTKIKIDKLSVEEICNVLEKKSLLFWLEQHGRVTPDTFKYRYETLQQCIEQLLDDINCNQLIKNFLKMIQKYNIPSKKDTYYGDILYLMSYDKNQLNEFNLYDEDYKNILYPMFMMFHDITFEIDKKEIYHVCEQMTFYKNKELFEFTVYKKVIDIIKYIEIN